MLLRRLNVALEGGDARVRAIDLAFVGLRGDGDLAAEFLGFGEAHDGAPPVVHLGGVETGQALLVQAATAKLDHLGVVRLARLLLSLAGAGVGRGSGSRGVEGDARIGADLALRLVRSPRVDRGAGAGSGSGSGAHRVVRVVTATGRVSKDAAGGSRAREGLGFVSGSRVVPASPPPAPGRASPPPSGADPHP